jgi:hypothetical protein
MDYKMGGTCSMYEIDGSPLYIVSYIYTILIRKPEGKTLLRPRHRWKEHIKTNLRETEWESTDGSVWL